MTLNSGPKVKQCLRLAFISSPVHGHTKHKDYCTVTVFKDPYHLCPHQAQRLLHSDSIQRSLCPHQAQTTAQ